MDRAQVAGREAYRWRLVACSDARASWAPLSGNWRRVAAGPRRRIRPRCAGWCWSGAGRLLFVEEEVLLDDWARPFCRPTRPPARRHRRNIPAKGTGPDNSTCVNSIQLSWLRCVPFCYSLVDESGQLLDVHPTNGRVVIGGKTSYNGVTLRFTPIFDLFHHNFWFWIDKNR